MKRFSVAWIAFLFLAGCGGSSNNSRQSPPPPPPSPPPPNQAPTVAAGDDVNAEENTSIQLSGQASDPDGDPVTATWSQVSGPSVDIINPSALDTAISLPPVDIGTTVSVVLRLTATDSRGTSTDDELTLTVSSTDFVLYLSTQDMAFGSVAELYKYDTVLDSVTKLSGSPPLSSITEASIAPDGQFVAFLANKNTSDVDELYVASVDGASEIRVDVPGTNPDGSVETFEWSPDGLSLAYIANAEAPDIGEAFVVDRDGANHRKISVDNLPADTDVGSIRWSPSGRTVSYNLAPINQSFLGPWFELHDLSANTSVRVLPTAPYTVVGGPIWSPDGAMFGFFAQVDGDVNTLTVFAAGADGSGQVHIANDPTRFSAFSILWSPDSSRIAYQDRDRTTSSFDVSIATPDGSSNVRVNPPLPATGNVSTPLWSPDGSRLAYSADIDVDDARELYVADVDTLMITKINGPLAPGGGPFQSPGEVERFIWAPDGSRIAYLAEEDGDGFEEVFLAAADGSANIRLTAMSQSVGRIGRKPGETFSPDSSQLAFKLGQLFVAQTDDNTVTQVSEPLPAPRESFPVDSPLWSSDGSRLAYVMEERLPDPPFQRFELRMAAPDGSEDRTISDPTMADGQIVGIVGWSP